MTLWSSKESRFLKLIFVLALLIPIASCTPPKPEKDMELISDAEEAALWIAGALRQSGCDADFTVDSLYEIERFFAEHSYEGKSVPGGLLAENTGSRVFALGAYIGEVLIRAKGGEWYAEVGDPEGEINIEVRFSDGERIWPMQRTLKRLMVGPEENIGDYGRVIVSDLEL